MSSNNFIVKDPYAFFWKQYLSNWQHSPFTINNQIYDNVEMWMMAEKARIFNDNISRDKILKAKNPKECKDLGRIISNYDETTWSKVREEIVLTGTLEKYRQNPDLLKLLLKTNNLTFVEASPYDNIWGIGMNINDPNIMNTKLWGKNLLGKVITKARDMLVLENG